MLIRTTIAIVIFILSPAFLFSQTVLIVGNAQALSHTHSSTLRCQVELTEPCEVSINLTGWLNTLNWDVDYDRIYIYNSDEKPIGIEKFGSLTDPFLFHMMSNPDSLVFRVGKAGTYYIDFHSGSNWGWPEGKTSQNYTVLLSVVTANDTHEPNDDINAASVINLNEVTSAFQWRETSTDSVWGDEDWYKLTLPSSGILTLELNKWLSVYNWGTDFDRLYVYNSNGEAIGGQSKDDPYYSWMMSGKEIVIDLETAGNYTVRLHSGSAYSKVPYTVKFELEPATGVEDRNILPNEFSLSQNYPNPFNPTTTIKYGIPEQSNVKIELFNSLGQSVGVLVNGNKSAGYYETGWNAENLPSGIYLISIKAEGMDSKEKFVQVKKALLLK